MYIYIYIYISNSHLTTNNKDQLHSKQRTTLEMEIGNTF